MSTPAAPTPPEGLPQVPPSAVPPAEPPPFSILPPPPPPPGEFTVPLRPFPAAPPRNRAVALAFTALVVSLLAATAALFAWGTSHPVNPQGPPGPPGPAGATGPRGHNHVSLCIRYDPANGDVANITVPVNGVCGTSAVLIQVP